MFGVLKMAWLPVAPELLVGAGFTMMLAGAGMTTVRYGLRRGKPTTADGGG